MILSSLNPDQKEECKLYDSIYIKAQKKLPNLLGHKANLVA